MSTSGMQSTATSATDTGLIWKAAVDQYEKVAKVNMLSLKSADNVEQILSLMQEKESKFDKKRHDGSKLEKLRSLVKKSLNPIQLLSDVASKTTKMTFPPGEAIFAAILYLINIANAVSAGYDKIARLFRELDLYLNQLKILEKRITPFPDLRLAVTEVLTSMLVLLGFCTKAIRTSRVSVTFQRLFASEDDELEAAYEAFRNAVCREQGVVRNATYVTTVDIVAATQRLEDNTSAIQSSTYRVVDMAKSQETDHEREKILEWFSTLIFHEKQRQTYAKCHPNTCEWIFHTSMFQRWFTDSEIYTLWCPGIPGAGKTVLISKAINFVEENTERSKVAIAFVYCDYKDPQTQSDTDLLSSMTRQLVEQCKVVPQDVIAHWQRFIERRRLPTNDERLALMKSVTKLFEKTYIFIDALDECGEGSRDSLLRLMKGLKDTIRLCVASRSHLQLETKLHNVLRLDIEAHEADVKQYITFQVDTNERLNDMTIEEPSLRSEIIQRLTDTAAGMFLLPHLQLLHLGGQSTISQVRKALKWIPTNIFELYDSTMRRIECQSESDHKVAKKALSYISCARRPLNMDELRHVLSVGEGDTTLDKHNLISAKALLSISAGLIYIDKQSNTTALIHYTLQEYLHKNRIKLMEEPEIELASACLIYLSFDVFGNGPCVDEEDLKQRLLEYCFLEYAAHYWGDHAMHGQLHARLRLTMPFLHDESKLRSSVQVLHLPMHRRRGWHDCFPTNFTSLHAAAYWGLVDVLRILREDRVDIDSRDEHGSTALHLAARRGHVTAVDLLIHEGAAVGQRDNTGATALHLAARDGHKIAVELLMAKRGDPAAEDNEGWSTLDWAVMKGRNDVVEVLLSRVDDSTMENDQRSRALILAAEAGNETAVHLLLDHEAQIDWQDPFGSTALHWAVPEGHESVVRALLKRGADIESRDIYLNTSLHWATQHVSVARILLENRAEVNAMNDNRQTALLWCAQDGQVEVLRLLLENRANVNTKDKYGFTALHAAALKGNDEIVRELLIHGADPNLTDIDQWTPLHAAALRQDRPIMLLMEDKVANAADIVSRVTSQVGDRKQRALLEHMAERKSGGSTAITGLRWAVSEGRVERLRSILDNGADIDAEDVGGITALTIGAWMDQCIAIQVLLERGADVNKSERSGRSALHIASEEGYLGVVELLADYGADVNAEVCGFTAILLAAKRGHEVTVRFLVQRGANVHVEDYHGRGLLHWAARYGSSTGLDILLKKGVEIDAADRWGKTPLMWAIENGQTKISQQLLDAGADFNCHAEDASTALHLAAYIGSSGIVEQLLQRGADANTKTRDEFTALHIAALVGNEAVVHSLCGAGASKSAQVLCPKTDEVRKDYAAITRSFDINVEESEGKAADDLSTLRTSLSTKVLFLLQQFVHNTEENLGTHVNVQQLLDRGASVAMKELLAHEG
ncbi:hypothetical protein LTR37_019429 [Vermiconidia calcicola]|uniref:Uncharacterized protein n=1 Tax=Vermiconidia calcicola TaxID=1690605 RepID=A0ACC3MFP0_9PEZI|nr:hypothetical protein LTR37_019429 [Vermiconidia calcicola]